MANIYKETQYGNKIIYHAPAINLLSRSSCSINFQLCIENYDFCENVKFQAIS